MALTGLVVLLGSRNSFFCRHSDQYNVLYTCGLHNYAVDSIWANMFWGLYWSNDLATVVSALGLETILFSSNWHNNLMTIYSSECLRSAITGSRVLRRPRDHTMCMTTPIIWRRRSDNIFCSFCCYCYKRTDITHHMLHRIWRLLRCTR